MDNPAPAESNAPTDPVAQLLEEIIESVHPLMAEAFFCAALPHWYDLPLFTAIRAKDDERNEGLIPRLEKYSFILPLPDTGVATFRTRDSERELLNRRWIKQDAAAYVAAHRRAHGYWQTVPPLAQISDTATIFTATTFDEITHAQNELYHQYFVSLTDAAQTLTDLFRTYRGERLLAAVERLLHTADEARAYLHLLQKTVSPTNGTGDNGTSDDLPPNDNNLGTSETENAPAPDPGDLANFDHLVEHLYARQAQLQGNWLESIAMFEALRNKPGLTPELVPFVARGYALSLKEMELYVESIEEYKQAIRLFKRMLKEQSAHSTETQSGQVTSYAGLQSELGLTMIDLGEAYVDFALSANVDPSKAHEPYGWWQRLQNVYEFLTALPLVVYLSIYVGQRVWYPSFWRVLENLDWIIGRLFGKGADQYLRADKILEEYGSKADAVLANEKLAYLYLKMGDFAQARSLFVELLEQTPSPLSEYHRALVRRGLAEAELGLSEPESARIFLQKSLPILRKYGDASETAEAQTLLAETMLTAAEPAQALDQFEQALAYHQKAENREKSTSIYERLGMLLRSGRFEANDAERAQTLAETVTKRRYPVRFRSLTTIFTQRALLVLLSLFFMVMPLLIIQLESRTQIAPEINFRVPPLLLNDEAFKPKLDVGVTAFNVTDVSEADVLVRYGAVLLLFYLLFVTFMGVLAIINTPLQRMQHTMRAKAIDVDEYGIRVGSDNVTHIVPWKNMRKLLRSDMSMFTSRLRVDDSLIVLANSAFDAQSQNNNKENKSENDQTGLIDSAAAATLVTIRGSTAWYSSLGDWLAAQMPGDSDQQELSYSWLRNWAGLFYGFGLLSLVLLTFYMWLTRSRAITADLPLLRYSLFDLYPYLYLLLFIPPMLWFIFRPLRIRSYLVPHSYIPWVVGAAGLLLFTARFVTQFRPWLTVPGIYPAGVILFMIVGSAATIWQARDPISRRPSFPLWARGAAAIVATVVTIVTGTYVAREVVSYHYLVNGHYFRDQEQRLNRTPPISQATANRSNKLLSEALGFYQEARRIAAYPLPGIIPINENAAQRYGVPKYDQTVWYAASKNVADIATKLELAELEPQKIYSELLLYAPEDGQFRLNIARALAMAGQARNSEPEFGRLQEDETLYRDAIAQFTEAIQSIEAVDSAAPDKEATIARYTLWRGVANHALYSPDREQATIDLAEIEADYIDAVAAAEAGYLDNRLAAKALIGLGWLYYQEADNESIQEQVFEPAFKSFQQASIRDPQSVEALLGMGYVHFRQAIQQLSAFSGLGLQQRETAEGKALTQRVNRKLKEAELVWLHAHSLNPFEPAIPISLATLYWKQGELNINVDTPSRCAEYEKATDQLDQAVMRDAMRIQQDSDVAFSYRTRAQITWLLQDIGCPEFENVATIEQAINDYTRAIALDQSTASYWYMRARLTTQLVAIHQEEAGRSLQNQRTIQLKIAPLLLRSLEDMDEALKRDPHDNAENSYEPNRFLSSVLTQSFNNGYSLLIRREIERATDVYTAAILTAVKYKNQGAAVSTATEKLAQRLAVQPVAEGEEIQRALERTTAVLAITDPEFAFVDAVQQFATGNIVDARNSYQRALRLAVDAGNIESVAEALSALYAEGIGSVESVIDPFGQVFPQLTQVQNPNSNTDALNLAFIAAAIGKTPISMYWYAEGIRRSTPQGVDAQMSSIEQAQRLISTWENNGVQLQAMLNNIPDMISDQLYLYPELADNGEYWRMWSWSIYHLGKYAFLAGDEDAAKNALVVGQPYADQATEVGKIVHTYYLEGALSWFHFLRARNAQNESDYRAALADYRLAADISQARTNKMATEERAQAAFRAGLMALYLDDKPLAISWYQQGLAYVDNDAGKGNMETQRLNAIAELQNAITANPALGPTGESILQTVFQVVP